MVKKVVTYSRQSRRQRGQRKSKKNTRLGMVQKMTGAAPETPMDRIANIGGTIGTIAKTVGGIISMINVEDKFKDTYIGQSITTPSTFSVLCNDIAQGSDYNQRNGNKILCKCWEVKFVVKMNNTKTTPQFVRVVMLIDKKPQLGTPVWSTVYGGNDALGLIDKNNVGERFIILKDHKICLNPSGERLTFRKFFMKQDRIHVHYTGPTATAIEENSLRIIAIVDDPDITNPPTFAGVSRFCFMDN